MNLFVQDPTPPSEYCIIPLSQGLIALVDLIDYASVVPFKWYANRQTDDSGRFRAFRVVGDYKNRTSIYMHRQILGLLPGDPREGDHRNPLYTLDNRRYNLRISTHAQNTYNRRRNRNNTSGYKGVGWCGPAGMWRAYIKVNYKQIILGYRHTAEAAWRELYVPAVLHYHGEFSRIY